MQRIPYAAPRSLIACMAIAACAAPAAHATAPLPAATVSASMAVCTTDPCVNGFSQSTATPGYVQNPLSQFGHSYTVSVSAPGSNPSSYTYLKSTPGVMSLGVYGSSNFAYVAIDGSPRVTAAASNTAYVGGTITSGTLSYNFKVIDTAHPNSNTPVTIGLSGAGSLHGSATAPPSASATFNAANVTADLTVNYIYDEKATASFSNFCIDATGICQTVNNSTANVDVIFGAETTTYSGAFTLAGKPLNIDTNLLYGVTLSVALGLGGAPGVAYATVDPTFTIPDGYTLELSPGISNGAVPEPSVWALMIAGMGAVGSVSRRNRRRAAAVAA